MSCGTSHRLRAAAADPKLVRTVAEQGRQNILVHHALDHLDQVNRLGERVGEANMGEIPGAQHVYEEPESTELSCFLPAKGSRLAIR